MKKIIIFLVVILVLVVVSAFFLETRKEGVQEFEGLKVGASFYPLAEFAAQAGGEKVQVHNLTPAGAEPHDFEPTARDVQKIFDLDVFLFVGAGFEPWAEKMEEELEKKGVEVLEMAKIIEFRHIEDDEEAKDEEDEHGEEGLDAHFWLDPVLAKIALEAITDTFAKLDAENRENYLRNAQEYLAKLADLDQNYRQGLAQCRLREIIVAHDAFSYVGARYNITIHAIAGLSPHEEPTPRRMAELATLAREKGISYVFFETLTSPRLAETIAREVGAQTLVLNPIEGLTAKEQAEGKNYLALMEENLQALKLALSCE